MGKGMREVHCSSHGKQRIGLVCTHVAHAVHRGEKVGFFFGDDTDTARPDAWCQTCETALIALNGANSTTWFKTAEFKIFCAACWDEASRICRFGSV
jgi:hypothetical protein